MLSLGPRQHSRTFGNAGTACSGRRAQAVLVGGSLDIGDGGERRQRLVRALATRPPRKRTQGHRSREGSAHQSIAPIQPHERGRLARVEPRNTRFADPFSQREELKPKAKPKQGAFPAFDNFSARRRAVREEEERAKMVEEARARANIPAQDWFKPDPKGRGIRRV